MDGPPATHLRFVRAVRGAIVADTALDLMQPATIGWKQVREAWFRLERNGRPTPWDGLVGRASTRTGSAADLHRASQPVVRPRSERQGRRSNLSLTASRLGDESVDEATDTGSNPSLAPETTWIDEEHYVLSPPVGVETKALEVMGSYTWRYVGQAVYAKTRTPPKSVWREPRLGRASPAAGAQPRMGPDVRTKLMRHDRFGRIWVLHEVDAAGLSERLRRYDAVAGEPEERPTERFVFPRDDDGPRFLSPSSWSYVYCDGETEAIWGFVPTIENNSGDPLNRDEAAATNLRGMRSVLLETFSSIVHSGSSTTKTQTGDGSGSIIGSRFVLTAKHVIDGTTAKLIEVTTADGASFTGKSVVIEGGDDEEDAGDRDWAVLEVDEDLGVSPFFLSRRHDSVVDFRAFIRGFPGKVADGGNPCQSQGLSPVQFKAHGAVEAIGVFEEVLTLVSGAKGMSGSPFYYCWTGDCDDGSAQTAIMKGWTGFHTYGPLVSPIRDTILGHVS